MNCECGVCFIGQESSREYYREQNENKQDNSFSRLSPQQQQGRENALMGAAR
jgi:hypothetical protein